MSSTETIIKPYTGDFMASHKTGRLPDDWTIAAITRHLGGIKPERYGAGEGEDYDGKVTVEWQLLINGEECAIWDYKGARWSIYDPSGLLAKHFGNQPAELALAES